MKITVNETKIEIFDGATVESVIRKFDKIALSEIKKGKADVCDKYGNHIALSGSLHEDSQLTIKKL